RFRQQDEIRARRRFALHDLGNLIQALAVETQADDPDRASDFSLGLVLLAGAGAGAQSFTLGRRWNQSSGQEKRGQNGNRDFLISHTSNLSLSRFCSKPTTKGKASLCAERAWGRACTR